MAAKDEDRSGTKVLESKARTYGIGSRAENGDTITETRLGNITRSVQWVVDTTKEGKAVTRTQPRRRYLTQNRKQEGRRRLGRKLNLSSVL